MPAPKPADHYRGDVEGLRAIAALSILVFHAMASLLPGGYLGVDLFFVISGYVITASICRESEAGAFSLFNFYARRIRRLYPALIVTVLMTLLASFLFLFPRELRHVSESAIATILYYSNFFFAAQSDYFSEDHVKPLLHTWSLAVEEQFYLVYPLFLMAAATWVRRRGRAVLMGALLFLCLASLALAELMVRTNPAAAYFASPARFWELAAGGLVAVLPPVAMPRALREALSIACLGLIAVPLLLFTDATPVPGLVTLIPVLGMAALIKAGEAPTLTARLLSLAPLRAVGRMSYSLYLVHWPLIVIAQANNIAIPHRYMAGILVVASLVLAWVLHRTVELPTQRLSLRQNRRFIFASGALGTAAVACVAGFILVAGGFRERFPAQSRKMIAFLDYDARPAYRAGSCLMNAESERENARFDAATCIGAMSPKGRRVLLIGDSHAAQYYEALHDTFPQVQLAQVTATGCRPLLNADGSERCASLMQRTFRQLVGNRFFDTVIFAGRWRAEELDDLYRTVTFASRRASQIYILGPVIEYRVPLPRLLAFSLLDGKFDEVDGDESVDVAREWRQAQAVDQRMARLMQPLGPRVRYLSVIKAMCRMDDCKTLTPSGNPVQFDYGHLTYEGSLMLVQTFKKQGNFKSLMVPG